MAAAPTDLAAMAAAFGDGLRRAGIPVTTTQLGRFVRATLLIAPVETVDLYWAARVPLGGPPEPPDDFARVFARVFGGADDPAGGGGDRPPPVPPSAPAPDGRRRRGGPESQLTDGSHREMTVT